VIERLISLVGILVFIGIGYLISANRSAIKWRPVLWGIALQLIIAVMILRIPLAYGIISWIGTGITTFLEFSNVGAEFVFGADYEQHLFAFKILPIIIFFSAFVSILYYLGLLQQIVKIVAWVMQKTTQTSGAETPVATNSTATEKNPALCRRVERRVAPNGLAIRANAASSATYLGGVEPGGDVYLAPNYQEIPDPNDANRKWLQITAPIPGFISAGNLVMCR